MENIELLSAFYKHRGFKRRLLEGFRFLERNFTALFRVSSFVLIPFALAAAFGLTGVWCAFPVTEAFVSAVGLVLYRKARHLPPPLPESLS